MNYKDLTMNLEIVLTHIPEQYIPEIVDRIQRASAAILGEYASENQPEKLANKNDKNDTMK